jgi:hypothetical protein
MFSMSPHNSEAEDGLDCIGVDTAEKIDLCLVGEVRRREKSGDDAEGRTADSSFSRRRLLGGSMIGMTAGSGASTMDGGGERAMVHPARLGHRLSSSAASSFTESRTRLSASVADTRGVELNDAGAGVSGTARSIATVAGDAEVRDMIEAQDSFLRCLPEVLNNEAFDTRRRFSSAFGRLMEESDIELE